MSEALEGALAEELEWALLRVYERDREMFDADAMTAIETLLGLWEPHEAADAEPEALSYWAYSAYEALRAVCEAYAGRELPYSVEVSALLADEEVEAGALDVLDAEQIAAVLRQLQASISFWQERGGMRAYYESIRSQS